MNENRSMDLDNAPERQLRSVPSVDSALVATPLQSTEHLPELEVIETSDSFSAPGVAEVSSARPRTRLERLTEKHTLQRPNWAMADIGEAPVMSPSTQPERQIRRMPNTNLRAVPPSSSPRPQSNTDRHETLVNEHPNRIAQATPVLWPNWALAEDTAPEYQTSPPFKQEYKRVYSSERDCVNVGRSVIHPSRAAQISHVYQPVVSSEPPLMRSPVDSGWSQRRAYQTRNAMIIPTYTRQQPSESIYSREQFDSKRTVGPRHQSPRRPQDLRKVASSPNNHTRLNSVVNLHGPKSYYAQEEAFYKQMNATEAFDADVEVNQLGVDFSLTSFRQNEGLVEMELPESNDTNARLLQQHAVNHAFPQNMVRPMHSAPDLVQDSNVTFLQVHRPKPIRATEYTGVFLEHGALTQKPLGDLQPESLTIPGPRELRRVPRFSEMNALGTTEMQYRPAHDRIHGSKPTRTMVEHAFWTETFALQQQLAEDNPTVDSSPEFQYTGIDSQQVHQP